MSCEQGRCSAYSEDLRWRIVWQKLALGLDNKSIASNLCIDPFTVHRIAIEYYYYYQLYQLGTGGRSQKDLACTRCLPKAIRGYAALYNLWNS